MKKLINNTTILLFFLIGITSYSQFSNDFQPYFAPTNSCNNFLGNSSWEWRPSHGSPYGSSNKVELKVKDAGYPDYKTLSEGVFINMSDYIGFSIQSGYKYEATFYYQKTSDDYANVTFRAYLTKNALSVSSNSSCGQDAIPSVSNKTAIYDSNDNLDLTYSGQVKTITVEFEATDDYDYLWLYSDIHSNFMNDETNSIWLTQVSITTTGVSGCNLSSPSSLYTTSITDSSAKLDWSAVSGNSGYQYAYRKSTTSSWTTGTTTNSYVNRSSLSSGTKYYWRVRTKCSNGEYGDWSSTTSFTTLVGCEDSVSITSNVSSGVTDNQSAKTTLTATNIIYSGGNANYDAGTRVYLKPGFNAKSGSTFNAFIEGCSSTSSRTLSSDKIAEKQEIFEKEIIITDSNITLYPNPTNGICNLSSNQTINSYMLFNAYGSLLANKKVNSEKTLLNIQNLPSGVYIIKALLASGDVVSKKLIKN